MRPALQLLCCKTLRYTVGGESYAWEKFRKFRDCSSYRETFTPVSSTCLYFYLFIYLLLLYGRYAKGLQATGACSLKKHKLLYIHLITLINYNLAIVFESLMVVRVRDICCTDIDNGRYSDCHRQNELQNDST